MSQWHMSPISTIRLTLSLKLQQRAACSIKCMRIEKRPPIDLSVTTHRFKFYRTTMLQAESTVHWNRDKPIQISLSPYQEYDEELDQYRSNSGKWRLNRSTLMLVWTWDSLSGSFQAWWVVLSMMVRLLLSLHWLQSCARENLKLYSGILYRSKNKIKRDASVTRNLYIFTVCHGTRYLLRL